MNSLAVIGLEYVGLPLLVEFGKIRLAIGFDVAKYKVEACKRGQIPSSEISEAQIQQPIHAV